MRSRRSTACPFAMMVCVAWTTLRVFPAAAAPPPGGDATTPEATAKPRELGQVAWLRSFDEAAKRAETENKPVLILFQEVPGCSTCVKYGDDVLSHPLIIDAAETLFVPVAVYNNVKGDDERVLQSFDEPAWNNPVVRIVTHDRKPLAARVAGDYTVGGLASAMTESLQQSKRTVPAYLDLLAEECAARKKGLQQAVFEMHCFWEGEAGLGSLPGVVSTMPGFVRSTEVVEVAFDPGTIGYDALLEKAKSMECARRAYTRNDAQQEHASRLLGSNAVRTDEPIKPDKQPKYYLSQTAYQHVPMTPLQAARVNAAIHHKQDPRQFLSPKQVRLLGIVEKNPTTEWPDAIGAKDLAKAWHKAATIAQSLKQEL